MCSAPAVEKALWQSEKWIVAGNYHVVRDLYLAQGGSRHLAGLLDLESSVATTRRSLKRWWTRELLWGTNYEPFWIHLKLWSTDSLYHWLFKTYWRRKHEYPVILSQPEHRHLKLLRFTHPDKTEAWFKSF